MDIGSAYSEAAYLGSEIEAFYNSHQYRIGPCSKVTKKNGQP